MSLTEQQIEQLLKPINKARVLRDGKGHAHVSQQDITAHLIRVFGFGAFDIEVIDITLVYEEASEREKKNGNGVYVAWEVCYRALIALTIRDSEGNYQCRIEDGSTGMAQAQPNRGDAHDLAYKSAISLSIKRCAKALGDQFGLSLYNKGQMSALVMGTLVHGDPAEDVQDGVEQQVSLGNDEVDPEPAS
jgi:recombination DNA repair RAD52 pathway protein